MESRKSTASFLWGAATSAFQIEGAPSADGKGPSIWDQFCAMPGKTAEGLAGLEACDHYHRYREDVEIMRRLDLPAYRFSISWPRVIPQGRGAENPSGWDFYDRLTDCLCAAGIEPVATLFHWDLPAALQTELGGSAHPDLPLIFADYAEAAFRRLGDRVRYWLTINEPWCIVELGHVRGCHAPGVKDRAVGYVVAHNLIRAHGHAVARYRVVRRRPGAISLALNGPYSFPASESSLDRIAAQRAMEACLGWFGDPCFFGDYPAVMRERLGGELPSFSQQDASLLTGSMDFIALNYYTANLVRHAPGGDRLQLLELELPQAKRTSTGWSICPDGLYQMLSWLSRRYGGLPIWVTENGAAFDDCPDESGQVNDADRVAYLREHIAAVDRAIAAGINVQGYFVWSLLDNLEWAEGFSKRFGLVRCDFRSQRRTIKRSGHWYAELIAKRCRTPLRQEQAGLHPEGNR